MEVAARNGLEQVADDLLRKNAEFIAAANPAAVLELIADEQEATDLCDVLSALLGQIAIAVRGPEEPKRRHGFADLPSRVKTVVAEREQLKTENEANFHEREVLCANYDQIKAECEALRKDAGRYRWICDSACDLNFYAGGVNNDGPGDCRPIIGHVEIDQGQYPVDEFGSAKAALDSQIDAAMSKEAQS